MVEKLKTLIKRVEAQKGAVALFMLWKESSDIDKWTVVISAKWIDGMNQRLALEYWIKSLQANLNEMELNTISRVSFLKTNEAFVQFLTRTLNVAGGAVRFTNNQVGNYHIKDAIIFEAKVINKAPLGAFHRNPALNGIINPFINGTINPNINGTINPNINGTINPNINGTINPNINGTINPFLNPSFTGWVLYGLNLEKLAYFVEAPREVLLMFDFNNAFIGFCIRAKENFYVVFDTHNNWIGYFVSNKKEGFNYFSPNAQWLGFVV
jgi:hypothetical protein